MRRNLFWLVYNTYLQTRNCLNMIGTLSQGTWNSISSMHHYYYNTASIKATYTKCLNDGLILICYRQFLHDKKSLYRAEYGPVIGFLLLWFKFEKQYLTVCQI